ncbi:unnamed protein product [Brassica napus]|uniref:(rape) hypothetical protein n=1 Tax=Brassica napus TaxID=3708 RepID=A0A816X5S4_BRANA|nr:unnamed protein product [Brassica napus]
MTEYLDNHKYLPKLNNERPDQRNYTYKDRFTSLRNLVLVKVRSPKKKHYLPVKLIESSLDDPVLLYILLLWTVLRDVILSIVFLYYQKICKRHMHQSLSSFFALFQFCVIFEECIENNMSKAEILSYVHDKYLIPLHDTNRGKLTSHRIIK